MSWGSARLKAAAELHVGTTLSKKVKPFLALVLTLKGEQTKDGSNLLRR
jgi:hypothetical protein